MTTPSGGVELAQVWVPLMPEASRLAKGVNDIASSAEKRFGRAGKVLGGHLAKGIDQGSRQAVASMKDVERATDQLAKARSKDEDAAGRVRVAQARLDDVLAKGKSTAAQRVNAEEALARAQRQREQATDQLSKAERQLSKAQSDNRSRAVDMPLGHNMADSGSSAGVDFLSGFGDGIEGIGTKAGPIGMAIAAAGGVALAGGGFIAQQLWAGMQAEQRRDVIAARLGLDEPTMARYAQIAARSYTQNFGDSVEGNIDTIGSAIQAGLIGKDAGSGEIERTLAQLETAKTVLGEDIPQVSRAVGQMMKTGLVDSVEDATDAIIAGQQQGANLGGDWLDTLNEYSTQFRKLGLDAGTATVLVGQMVSAGARDSDVAADAIKEFSIRAIDGSKTTTEAFAALGMNADTMTAAFAEGGPAATRGLTDVITAIQKIPDPAEKSRVQVALFGTQAEDLGAALDAMDMGKVAQGLEQVAGSTKRASDTMADNAANSVESARRNIEVAATNTQAALARAFGPHLDRMGSWFRNNQGDIVRFFSGVGSAALKGLDGFGAFASGSLRFLASVSTGARAIVPKVIGAFSAIAGGAGDVLSLLPGQLGDMGRKLQGAAEAAKRYAQVYANSGDTLNDWADKVDALRSGLPGAAEELTRLGEETADVTDLMTALGDATIGLPDGKTITLTDNTPEVQQRLKQLGIEVQELPDGTLTVLANTDEGARIIESWRRQETNQPVAVPVGADTTPARDDLNRFFSELTGVTPQRVPVSVNPSLREMMLPPGGATGGRVGNIIRGPGTGTSDSILAQAGSGHMLRVANGESINTERSTRANWPVIDAMNRGANLAPWFRQLPRFNEGGLIDYATSLVGQEYSQGARWDCSGTVARLVNHATGMHDGGLMTTKNAADWLAARGFVPGMGGPDDLTVGWYDRGPNPNDGHMAATLPGGINAEQGGRNGVFTLGSGAAGADDPQFDQRMYLPMNAMWPQGAGAGGGGSRGGGGGSGSGGYSSGGKRASAITAAESQLADAEGDVLEKQAALAEVEADTDAAESDKIRARNDRDKAIRDRDAARAELTEAQNTPVDSGTGSGESDGPSGESFGQDLMSGLMEAVGLDGSVFGDPTQWGIWKLFTGGANYLGGLLKNFQTNSGPARLNPYGGAPGGAQHGRGSGSPGPGNAGDGGLGAFQLGDGGGMSGMGGALMGALPQARDYLPSAATQTAGPIDASITVQGNVDNKTFGAMRGMQHDRVRTAGSGMRGLGGGF